MASFSADIIESRSNPLITRMAKLSDKKYRDREGFFRIDGVKLFSEAVSSGVRIEYIFIADTKRDKLTGELSSELSASEGTVIFVSDEVLAKLTDEAAPQGIVTVARKFDLYDADIPADGDFRAMYLSSIRDPGNLGTMIRTAYAFGVERIYISSDCADLYSPKTLRAAMGTVFRQPIAVVTDEAAFADHARKVGCELYAAALRRDAKKLGTFDMPSRVCFAIGNEGHGLSDEFIDACSATVFIPMTEGCESLNAAMAATVIMWEMQREMLARVN
ncbi:MAG: RNA methyltransferase [Clostridia bacterium]|nr:RNA methyltransferase [Clostridia bacterium]